jgi:2-hydroxy-6-oxonona-2,4-dienedioate hydrolase
MTNTPTGYVDLGDGKVYYEVAGEGPPLVFLHAGFVDSGMWDDQWREFSKHYTVIRFDNRGFGKSDPVEQPPSRRKELYGVLEQVGAGKTVLVGCSLGGETILDAALERPELVSSLVIVSAVPGGFELQGEMPPNLIEMMAALEQGDLALASELQIRIWVDGPFREPDQVDTLLRLRAAGMNRNALEKGVWGLAVAQHPDPIEPPAVERLGQIHAPVLVVAGDQDNPEILRAAKMMVEAIPNAQEVILSGCAHLPNMEKPAEFNQAVLDFLQKTANDG